MIELAIYFMFFSAFGVAQEVFWTSLMNLFRTRKPDIMGTCSLWMFPIYGCVLFIIMIGQAYFSSLHFLIRGLLYMLMIYVWEYVSGFMLKKAFGTAPWDYSGKRMKIFGRKIKTNLHGLICLEYGIIWYIGALLAEVFYLFLKSHLYI